MRLSLIRLLPRVRTHHQIHDDTHAPIACDMLNPAQCPEHALMARIPLGLGHAQAPVFAASESKSEVAAHLHELRLRRLHHNWSCISAASSAGQTIYDAARQCGPLALCLENPVTRPRLCSSHKAQMRFEGAPLLFRPVHS